MRAQRLGAVGALVAYIATIPAANMAVTHFGVVPVGLGYLAPAGVYLVGIALVLRDLARETAGRWPVAAAVLVGAALSYSLASPALATASAAAFALSEGLDFMVYEPLRKRGLLTAMVVSNLVGMLADSLVFLTMAFGSLQFLPGQLLGKAWMTVAAVAVIAARRRLATT
ncbi:VUT family protein [Kitasatospora sp. NPDC056184]|uniref:VUT family protein n=1 Tax=Kitasatospora sp. NPDC056184 TaxID=3345738 RepID=UPI0035DBBB5B